MVGDNKNRKEWCFAFVGENSKCKILKKGKCLDGDCSFFKTSIQLAEEQKKTLDRLRSLEQGLGEDFIRRYFKNKDRKKLKG